MSWKDMIRKKVWREICKKYGPDYIDRLTDMAAKDLDKVLLEAMVNR